MTVILVMGVAGSGKTTIGRALAERLGYRFVEADELHPPANIEKMRRGVPLEDADRWPWLDAVAAQLQGDVVVACSALKESYRARLKPTRIVYLDVPREELARRVSHRPGHFFPAALLDSQLADLEVPSDAIVVDGTRPLEEVVDVASSKLGGR
jgi:gluconokinase